MPPGTTQTSARISSTLRILVNASYWCSNTTIRCGDGKHGPTDPRVKPCGPKRQSQQWCADPGAPNAGVCGGPLECGKGPLSALPTESVSSSGKGLGKGTSDPWIELNLVAGKVGGTVVVDLSPLNGSAPLAVRYGWGNEQTDCCVHDKGLGLLFPCPPAACPIMGKNSRLPANPFLAKIVGNKCECVAPQVCDE